MKKLHDLRQHLLDCPLQIPADKLLTFTRKGHLTSAAGRPFQNGGFSVSYLANVVITDFTGDAIAFLYILTQWLHTNQPGMPPEALKFQVDIIDHQKADLSIEVELTDVVKVEQLPEGTQLTTVQHPNVFLQTLFGGYGDGGS